VNNPSLKLVSWTFVKKDPSRTDLDYETGQVGDLTITYTPSRNTTFSVGIDLSLSFAGENADKAIVVSSLTGLSGVLPTRYLSYVDLSNFPRGTFILNPNQVPVAGTNDTTYLYNWSRSLSGQGQDAKSDITFIMALNSTITKATFASCISHGPMVQGWMWYVSAVLLALAGGCFYVATQSGGDGNGAGLCALCGCVFLVVFGIVCLVALLIG